MQTEGNSKKSDDDQKNQ